jgi:uncharacterized protein (TIRG00374 family)
LTFQVGTLARVVVTAALVIVLLRLVDLGALGKLIAAANPLLLAAAVALSVCDRVLMFGKWFPLLRARVPQAPFWPAARAYLASGLAQYVLPVTVGADVLRASAVGQSQKVVAEVGASIVAERLLGLLASGIMSAVALFVALRESIPVGFLIPWAVISIAASGAVLLLPFTRIGTAVMRRAAQGLPERAWVRFLRRMAQGYAAYRTRASLLLTVGLLSVVEQGISIVIVGVVAKAMGIAITAPMLLVTMPLTLFVARLPISMGGIGVGEAAVVYLLGLFGVPSTDALAISLVCRALDLLVATVPGLILWRDLVRPFKPGS